MLGVQWVTRGFLHPLSLLKFKKKNNKLKLTRCNVHYIYSYLFSILFILMVPAQFYSLVLV